MGKNSFPVYIPLEEAAQRYGLNVSAIENAIKQGLVRAASVNGRILISETDVRQLQQCHNSSVFPRYIPIDEAADKYSLPLKELEIAAKSGKIRAIRVGNDVLVREMDLKPVAQNKIVINKKDFDHLSGKAISISDASRKYGLPTSTLSRWSQKGYIKRLGKEGKKVLLDEADVAYRVAIYRSLGGRAGIWAFDQKGKPYQLKNPHRSKHTRPLVIAR